VLFEEITIALPVNTVYHWSEGFYTAENDSFCHGLKKQFLKNDEVKIPAWRQGYWPFVGFSEDFSAV
jgi:hypothetical protein